MEVYRVTRHGLDRWRAVAGQDGVNAWCVLHELDPNNTAVDVEIDGDTVRGHTYHLDAAGKRHLGADGDVCLVPFARTLVTLPPPVALDLVL